MKMTQISVFLENRKGRLYEVSSLLGDNNIDIMAFTIAETENFGILRMVVNKPEEAIVLLKKNQFAANLTHVVVVEVEDKPGGLAAVLKVLNDNDINIEYMHAFIKKHSGRSFMVFRFDDPDAAMKVLDANNINVVTEDTMQDF